MSAHPRQLAPDTPAAGGAPRPSGDAPELRPPADDAAEHRRVLVVLSALMLGMVLASLDQTIVATALPTIAGDLHGLNHLAWVVTAYLLTSTISTPLWGKLGDLYGRKNLYQGAIVIFLVGSALCGLSQNMGELIAFRALQGIGAGGLLVGSQAIVGDVVSPRQRGRYMGYFGAAFGITSVVGPLLGGFFTQHLSWRWVFYVNLPIGVVALFVIAAVLHLPKRRTEHAIDYLGTLLLGLAVTSVILLTTWGGSTYAWGSKPIVMLAALAVVLAVAFFFVELRAAEPVLPLRLFRNRTFTMASLAGFVIGCVMFGVLVFLPLYLQVVRGATPTSSGLQLLPMVGGMLVTFILAGQLVSRTGRYKIFPIVGTAVLTVGLWFISALTPTTPLVAVWAAMFVAGLGIGLVMQVIVVAVQNAVPYSQLGVATSTSSFLRSIGGSFGVALFGAIFESRLVAELTTHLPAGVPPSVLHAVKSGDVSSNPAQIARLTPPVHHIFVFGFSHALHTVFLVAVPLALAAFVVTWGIREVPLREHTGPAPAEADSVSSLA
jgi:EmrB/QacA subfamily drug resistance transporter